MINFTKGSSLGNIIRFSIPLLIGNMFQQLYTVIDSALLGHYVSPTALAAVGTSTPINMLMLSIIGGFTLGTSIVTASLVGKGKEGDVKRLVESTFIVDMLIGIFLAGISFFWAREILSMMDTPQDVMKDAITYLRIVSVGLIFQCLYQYMTDVLRGMGDSKTPLYFLLLSTILNILLDLFFILVLSMDVSGVAYATLIAQFISAITCTLYSLKKYKYFKLSSRFFHPDRDLLKYALKMGAPSAMQQTVGSLGAIGMQSVVNSFGSIAINAYTAAYKVDNFIMLPITNVGVALGVFVAQNAGAGQKNRIREGFKKTSIACFILSIGLSAIIFITAKDMIRIFIDDQETIILGTWGLRVLAIPFFLCSELNLYISLFKGLGKVNIAFFLSAMQVVIRLVVCFGFAPIAAIGLNAVWFAMPTTWVVGIIISFWYYKRKGFILNEP